MKILLTHNYYGSAAPSGENVVFEAERTLLRNKGHDVVDFVRRSDEIRGNGIYGKLKGGVSTPWNVFAARALRARVAQDRPDVVHAHNTFPLISPSIFHAVGHRAARVLTLHNYRIFCAAGIPMRDGNICTDCIQKRSVMPALMHACYRDSRVATVPLAVSIALHRALNTWMEHVDAFITLTEFQKNTMIDAGIPADLVHVKPNFFPGDPEPVAWHDRKDYVVFAGRLTAEKGVETLLNAWLKWGSAAPELRIAGDGELRQQMEAIAASAPNARVSFLGSLSLQDAQSLIAAARLLVLPSTCLEGFPMVLREAFAFGTPAAVSNIGALPSIVQHGRNGLVFEPGDEESLLDTVRSAWTQAQRLQSLGDGARKSFETLYTEDANYSMLMKIYDEAIAVSRRRRDAVS